MSDQGAFRVENFDTLDRRQLCRAHLLSATLALQAAHAIAERIADDTETRLPFLIADTRALVMQSIAQIPLENKSRSGAWTCKRCGFVGFWEGGPHCGPGSLEAEQTITHGVVRR